MMSQTSIEHLFQLTLPDRGSTGTAPGQADRPTFGHHLFEAAETARSEASRDIDLRDRVSAYPPPDDQNPAADFNSNEPSSSRSELPPQECGACGKANNPAACCGEDSTHSDDSTFAEPADGLAYGADGDDQQPGEAGVDDDEPAEYAVANVSPGTERATTPELGEIAAEDATGNNGGTTKDVAETDPSHPRQCQPMSPSTANSVTRVAAGFATTGNSSQVTHTGEHIPSTLPHANNENAGRAIEASTDAVSTASPKDGKSQRTKQRITASDGDTTSGGENTKSIDAVQVKSERASAAARTSKERGKPADDSRDRSNSGVDSRSVPRKEATAIENASAPTAVQPIQVSVNGSTSKANLDGESAHRTKHAVTAKSETLLQSAMRSSAHGIGRRERSDSAEDTPRIDAARFVSRVSKAIQTAHERGGTLQLRLSPPELGTMRLELSIDNGAMTAALETENPVARQVLLDHLPSLRERLAEQNIRIERFDVDVRQDASGGQADARASQHEHREQGPKHTTPRHTPNRAPDGDDVKPRPAASSHRATKDGINLLA
jgi:flagellar hook-length control protein FliK